MVRKQPTSRGLGGWIENLSHSTVVFVVAAAFFLSGVAALIYEVVWARYLALLLGKGSGCPRDEREAAAWFRMAAEQGHQAAQFNLAASYEAGLGVPKNLVMAYVWFALAGASGTQGAYRTQGTAGGLAAFRGSLASNKGGTAAIGNRNRLWLLLTDNEREIANQLAEEYYVKHLPPFR